jgi:cysteine desulfuration protein SufE
MQTNNATSLPARLAEIVADFEISEGREKIELLIQYAEQLPPLPNWLQAERAQMEPVPECMTPVFIKAVVAASGPAPRLEFHFDIPAESPTVRGFASLMKAGLDGLTPQEILAIPATFFQTMGLDRVLTSQRLNGLTAILAHAKRQAAAALAAGETG